MTNTCMPAAGASTSPSQLLPVFPVQAVIFDMDGTLMDSTDVIVDCIMRIQQKMIGPCGPREDYRVFVGPPLGASFAQLAGLDVDNPLHAPQVDALTEAYRVIYRERETDILPFDGVVECLKTLKDAGIVLALATSKLESRAKALLDHVGLTPFFAEVCGASGDDPQSSSKAAIARRALCGLVDLGLLPSDVLAPGAQGAACRRRVVMVGDRIFDVEGAQANGIPAVGADWAGLALPGEFDLAAKVVISPAQLSQYLLGGR